MTNVTLRGHMAITEFMQVTLLANAYIDALNNLRHCAPLSIADRCVACFLVGCAKERLVLHTFRHKVLRLAIGVTKEMHSCTLVQS